ncbi:MAG: hypothetical protein J7639_02875 [Paenibacillaceae bacterium]|nr:hypothetical protein [Paenibacillaceae bacterium]
MPRWFNWKFSIFYKLALAFLLVITPLTYISLHFIKSGKRSVEEELQRSIDSRVQYYANLLEIDMARVTKLQREQLIDRDLLNMIYAASIFTDFERSQTMLRIRHNLELIAGTSNFVEKASAYMPTLGRVASNLYYGALPEEEYKAVETSVGQTGDESLMNWNGRLLQNMAYPKQAQAASGTGEAPTLVLSIEFSVPKLRQALAQLADYEQSCTISSAAAPLSRQTNAMRLPAG